jgi:hypothetical protein
MKIVKLKFCFRRIWNLNFVNSCWYEVPRHCKRHEHRQISKIYLVLLCSEFRVMPKSKVPISFFERPHFESLFCTNRRASPFGSCCIPASLYQLVSNRQPKQLPSCRACRQTAKTIHQSNCWKTFVTNVAPGAEDSRGALASFACICGRALSFLS